MAKNQKLDAAKGTTVKAQPKVRKARAPRPMASVAVISCLADDFTRAAKGLNLIAEQNKPMGQRTLNMMVKSIGRVTRLVDKALATKSVEDRLAERESKKAALAAKTAARKLERSQKKFAKALEEVNGFRKAQGLSLLDENGKEIAGHPFQGNKMTT